jgi:hypothetical protein
MFLLSYYFNVFEAAFNVALDKQNLTSQKVISKVL